jgi:hypothetical protein
VSLPLVSPSTLVVREIGEEYSRSAEKLGLRFEGGWADILLPLGYQLQNTSTIISAPMFSDFKTAFILYTSWPSENMPR